MKKLFFSLILLGLTNLISAQINKALPTIKAAQNAKVVVKQPEKAVVVTEERVEHPKQRHYKHEHCKHGKGKHKHGKHDK